MEKMEIDSYESYLFHEGNYFRGFELFGAIVIKKENELGTNFKLFAPNAEIIQVVGDFNEWDGFGFEMERVTQEGIWNLFIPINLAGEKYKYKITSNGKVLLKSDPYALYSELKPNTSSIVYPLKNYKWNDKKWGKKQFNSSVEKELNIYELHLGSWKKKDNGMNYSYTELVDELIPYIKTNKFTHIELLPIIEYPFDGSWGYQGTGYFSLTSRYGIPEEFMYFVDMCHQNGIGVIMDFVLGHFCKDEHGLYMFDGTATYEYENLTIRENEVWGTANFDLGKNEVQSFLISSIMFWIEKYHIDGFRIDAVANMLFYSLDGVWQQNQSAVLFLQKLNKVVREYHPHVLMIAEDSTDWPLVTAPVEDGGLGFHYKWNMGWMNDVLIYMECTPENRKYIHNKITFSMLYAFSENYILPLSHDEVVHGKKSLLNKMPGDYWQKFAQLRLLLGYMYTHPGKKLLFMGGEFGQFIEWDENRELDWLLFDYEKHVEMSTFTRDLFSLYKRTKPLWEVDNQYNGFEWIDADNSEQSIFSFIRRGNQGENYIIIICNFTATTYHQYKIGVPEASYREILNSDDIIYGGSGQINKKRIEVVSEPYHNQPCHIEVTIPPMGISILRPVKTRKGKVKNEEEVYSDATSRRARKQIKGINNKSS